MPPETLEALKESISHWFRLSTKKTLPGENVGAEHCSLCKLFNQHSLEDRATNCVGCPVYEKTGKQYCSDTPYEHIDNISYDTEEEFLVCPEFIGLANNELDFLQSLLPEDKK